MGNRACVVFKDEVVHSPAVYLHWNGGPESVYAFLEALERGGGLSQDPVRTAARFTQLVGNFFGGNLSLALFPIEADRWELTDPGDNGIYLVTLSDSPLSMRRLVEGVEWPPHVVALEEAESRTHAYRNQIPSLCDQVLQANRGYGWHAMEAA
jgi:hypothetical protein